MRDVSIGRWKPLVLGVALTVVLGGRLVSAGELGSRIEIGERESMVGWAHLSGEVGSISLSGRIEADLLCACLRRAQFGASTVWGDLSAGAETVVLSTGRADVSITGAWKTLWGTDLGLISAQVGGKGTVVDALGARFLTAAGWGFGRLDRSPFWVEANANLAWPGANPHAELRLGVTGPAWVTLSVSSSGTGVELGAEVSGILVQSYHSLRPAFQTLTIGFSAEGVRVQARVTVRAEGSPSGSLSVTASKAPWSGSVMLFLSRAGLGKVTAEVRYALGN